MLLKYLDLPTFMVASLVVDLEPFFVVITGISYPLHGLLHTFLGGTALAFALMAAMVRFRGASSRVSEAFGIKQRSSVKMVAAASFLGVYTHLLLDAPLYYDIMPLYPMGLNPLFYPESSVLIYSLCAAAFFLGISMYLAKLLHSGKSAT
ncbi:MAG: hypothetical protein NO516_06665 [Candidatus Methanomethylicia archaeon]|nr:hypothetical protein [Candidatus Methanomethylicia archaeon]